MRVPLVVLCLLAAGLSGCLGTEDGLPLRGSGAGGDHVTVGTSAPASIALEACDEQYGIFTTPASQAEAFLPPGFSLVGVGGDPLPEGPASLVVLTLECHVPGEDEPVLQAWIHLVVDPPPEHERPDAALHYIPLLWPVSEGAFLDALEAWGIPQATAADIVVEADPLAPGLASWSSTVTVGNGTAVLATESVGTHPPAGGGIVRVFGLADQVVTGAVDLQGTPWEGAAGVSTLSDADLVPVDVQGPGSGGLALGFDYVVTPVDLPASS